MKRLLATATLIAFFISIIPNSYAAVTAGSTCKKLGATSTYAGKKYTCIKSGKKLIWNKGVKVSTPKLVVTPTSTPAAGITCPVKGKCEIGNKGPGGGIVFYVAPTPQSWGQYLEVAPATWNGTSTDPRVLWCDVRDVSLVSTVTDPEFKKLIGTEIGKGKWNTQLMTAFCKSGVANLASAYRGGGKSDWFLPSKDELNQMYVNKPTIGDFASGSYWSSSEDSASKAWAQYFRIRYQYDANKADTVHVRPVRAFS